MFTWELAELKKIFYYYFKKKKKSFVWFEASFTFQFLIFYENHIDISAFSCGYKHF